jgi:hypothetical protein
MPRNLHLNLTHRLWLEETPIWEVLTQQIWCWPVGRIVDYFNFVRAWQLCRPCNAQWSNTQQWLWSNSKWTLPGPTRQETITLKFFVDGLASLRMAWLLPDTSPAGTSLNSGVILACNTRPHAMLPKFRELRSLGAVAVPLRPKRQ